MLSPGSFPQPDAGGGGDAPAHAPNEPALDAVLDTPAAERAREAHVPAHVGAAGAAGPTDDGAMSASSVRLVHTKFFDSFPADVLGDAEM